MTVLILHDATTFLFQRNNALSVGITHKSFVGKDAKGRPASRRICGLLMHSSLIVLGGAATRLGSGQVTSPTQAIEKLQWYAMRWQVETFHKIMKSGCKVEQSKLRTSERLVNLIALYCILGWRIFWTTLMQRVVQTAPATLAFATQELKLLDRPVQQPAKLAGTTADLSVYVCRLARLGGYLARSHDPPPGNIVIWRELSRLTEIELGFGLALEIVGN